MKYVLFDAGWSKPQDIFELNPEMDMDWLAAYAKEKNVGLVLWTSALAMEKQMDAALEQFSEWGVKGIMVDFMNRDDQPTINFLHKVAEKASGAIGKVRSNRISFIMESSPNYSKYSWCHMCHH